MTNDLWTRVDRFITDHLVPADPVLDAALARTAEAGMPAINVSPAQGKLLMLLAQIHGAKSILEVGTLGGYSTIWLARGLATVAGGGGGRIITLESEEKHAAVARENLAHAGFADVVDVRVGRALESLPVLATEGRGPFDLVFIDADKPNNPGYFEWALKLSRPGSVIVVDNVIRDGSIVDASNTDPRVVGTRRFYEMLAREPRVTATAIQTVGSKGYDGFAIARVN